MTESQNLRELLGAHMTGICLEDEEDLMDQADAIVAAVAKFIGRCTRSRWYCPGHDHGCEPGNGWGAADGKWAETLDESRAA